MGVRGRTVVPMSFDVEGRWQPALKGSLPRCRADIYRLIMTKYATEQTLAYGEIYANRWNKRSRGLLSIDIAHIEPAGGTKA